MSHRHPLDNPARAALLGPHAHLAQRHGQVLRYPPDVTPWHALPDEPDAAAWADLAALAGPGGIGTFAGAPAEPPPGWKPVMCIPGVQLVDVGLRAEPDPEAVRLGPADVPEMLALVERTAPGPFSARTIELGRYLGIRRAGRLIAMAGERLHPPGWTEISAVCTDVEHRGHGLATPVDPGGGRRHPGSRRDPVPARRGGQRRGRAALRVIGLRAAPPRRLRRPPGADDGAGRPGSRIAVPPKRIDARGSVQQDRFQRIEPEDRSTRTDAGGSMTDNPLHLAVALDGTGWHPASWREPGARPAELFGAGYWTDLVQEAERGLLDFVTIDDSLALQAERFAETDARTDRVRGRLDALLIAARVAPADPAHRAGAHRRGHPHRAVPRLHRRWPPSTT